MEATYAEYEEWSEKGVAETVAHLYKKAVEQLDKYKPFEEMLVNTFCSLHMVHVAAEPPADQPEMPCDTKAPRVLLLCAAGSRTSAVGRVPDLHRL